LFALSLDVIDRGDGRRPLGALSFGHVEVRGWCFRSDGNFVHIDNGGPCSRDCPAPPCTLTIERATFSRLSAVHALIECVVRGLSAVTRDGWCLVWKLRFPVATAPSLYITVAPAPSLPSRHVTPFSIYLRPFYILYTASPHCFVSTPTCY
jgi:hypothetical protein